MSESPSEGGCRSDAELPSKEASVASRNKQTVGAIHSLPEIEAESAQQPEAGLNAPRPRDSQGRHGGDPAAGPGSPREWAAPAHKARRSHRPPRATERELERQGCTAHPR